MSTASGPMPYSDPMVSTEISTVPTSAEHWMTEVHVLLRELETVTVAGQTLPPVFGESIDDQLVQFRLGVAASLFAAMQCKNAASAGHALRVALSCSAWAMKLEVSRCGSRRDRSGRVVARHGHDRRARPHSREAWHAGRGRSGHDGPLPQAEPGNPPPQLRLARDPGHRRERSAWYDGSRARAICRSGDGDSAGRADDRHRRGLRRHDHRPRLSAGPVAERAMAELFECSRARNSIPSWCGSSRSFARETKRRMRWEVAHRWLLSLDPETVDAHWDLNCVPRRPRSEPAVDALFQGRLLDNMYDAVVFIDAAGPRRALEPRRGTADGHRRVPAFAASRGIRTAGALRRKRAHRSARPIAP